MNNLFRFVSATICGSCLVLGATATTIMQNIRSERAIERAGIEGVMHEGTYLLRDNKGLVQYVRERMQSICDNPYYAVNEHDLIDSKGESTYVRFPVDVLYEDRRPVAYIGKEKYYLRTLVNHFWERHSQYKGEEFKIDQSVKNNPIKVMFSKGATQEDAASMVHTMAQCVLRQLFNQKTAIHLYGLYDKNTENEGIKIIIPLSGRSAKDASEIDVFDFNPITNEYEPVKMIAVGCIVNVKDGRVKTVFPVWKIDALYPIVPVCASSKGEEESTPEIEMPTAVATSVSSKDEKENLSEIEQLKACQTIHIRQDPTFEKDKETTLCKKAYISDFKKISIDELLALIKKFSIQAPGKTILIDGMEVNDDLYSKLLVNSKTNAVCVNNCRFNNHIEVSCFVGDNLITCNMNDIKDTDSIVLAKALAKTIQFFMRQNANFEEQFEDFIFAIPEIGLNLQVNIKNQTVACTGVACTGFDSQKLNLEIALKAISAINTDLFHIKYITSGLICINDKIIKDYEKIIPNTELYFAKCTSDVTTLRALQSTLKENPNIYFKCLFVQGIGASFCMSKDYLHIHGSPEFVYSPDQVNCFQNLMCWSLEENISDRTLSGFNDYDAVSRIIDSFHTKEASLIAANSKIARAFLRLSQVRINDAARKLIIQNPQIMLSECVLIDDKSKPAVSLCEVIKQGSQFLYLLQNTKTSQDLMPLRDMISEHIKAIRDSKDLIITGLTVDLMKEFVNSLYEKLTSKAPTKSKTPTKWSCLAGFLPRRPIDQHPIHYYSDFPNVAVINNTNFSLTSPLLKNAIGNLSGINMIDTIILSGFKNISLLRNITDVPSLSGKKTIEINDSQVDTSVMFPISINENIIFQDCMYVKGEKILGKVELKYSDEKTYTMAKIILSDFNVEDIESVLRDIKQATRLCKIQLSRAEQLEKLKKRSTKTTKLEFAVAIRCTTTVPDECKKRWETPDGSNIHYRFTEYVPSRMNCNSK